MLKKIQTVKIDSNYCDYLRQYDNRVPYNAGIKELRPFIGILFKVENREYFAPLSSPKPKHSKLLNTLDVIKIADGKLGIINFNNMIPVYKNNYQLFDLNKKSDKKEELSRIILLQNQLRWLNTNKTDIYFKSNTLYEKYIKGLLPQNVINRCCNFKLLEEKCKEYNTISS